MSSPFLTRLHSPDRPVIVFDGAMGTSLQTQNLTAEDFGGPQYEGCNEYLVHTKPEAVEQVHREFLAVGADVIETDTFGAASIVLAEYDLADQAYSLNKTAAQLAKRVASEFSTPEKPRFVAGSMGPTTNCQRWGILTTIPSRRPSESKQLGCTTVGLTCSLWKLVRMCCKSRQH
jgi:5-methyltetrahydrofolate--homocysteine methyltransferase